MQSIMELPYPSEYVLSKQENGFDIIRCEDEMKHRSLFENVIEEKMKWTIVEIIDRKRKYSYRYEQGPKCSVESIESNQHAINPQSFDSLPLTNR